MLHQYHMLHYFDLFMGLVTAYQALANRGTTEIQSSSVLILVVGGCSKIKLSPEETWWTVHYEGTDCCHRRRSRNRLNRFPRSVRSIDHVIAIIPSSFHIHLLIVANNWENRNWSLEFRKAGIWIRPIQIRPKKLDSCWLTISSMVQHAFCTSISSFYKKTYESGVDMSATPKSFYFPFPSTAKIGNFEECRISWRSRILRRKAKAKDL